jgi:UDP-N-acetylmuramate dehydrogenase
MLSSIAEAFLFITKLLYIYDNIINMNQIQSDFPLQQYNTFGIIANTAFYTEIDLVAQIPELIETEIFIKMPHLILGGGSNILFTQNFPGLTIRSRIAGFELIDEDKEYVYLRVGSGMIWDEFVAVAIENNWGGIENLSGIPGTIGASPIQNIGAYGAEAKDVVIKVEGFDFEQKTFETLDNASCNFGYRTSFFKEKLKNRFLVCYVTFRLKKAPHLLITNYGAIGKELEKYTEKNISTIRKAVCAIRNSKLPDPAVIGNAGSFFKNPTVEKDQAEELKNNYPTIPTYPVAEGSLKLSAAWLIDQAGCKGIQQGKAASHKDQPLVLVNLGGATGNNILELAQFIEKRVHDVFGVKLEKEVNIV